jgi:hypothetical protein
MLRRVHGQTTTTCRVSTRLHGGRQTEICISTITALVRSEKTRESSLRTKRAALRGDVYFTIPMIGAPPILAFPLTPWCLVARPGRGTQPREWNPSRSPPASPSYRRVPFPLGSSCWSRSGYIKRRPISTWQSAQFTAFRFRDHPPIPGASPQSDRADSDGLACTRACGGGCASFGDQAMVDNTEHLIS